MDIPRQSIEASTTGTYLVTGGKGTLVGARLAPAAAAASAIIRETDGSGRILYKLAAAANGNGDECRIPVHYTGQVHVTIAGAGAQLNLFQ